MVIIGDNVWYQVLFWIVFDSFLVVSKSSVCESIWVCWEYSFRTGSKRLNHQRSCLNVTPDPPPYKTSIASQFSKLHTCSSDCLLEQLKRQSPTFPWFSKQQNYIVNKPILSIVGKLTEQLKKPPSLMFWKKKQSFALLSSLHPWGSLG